MNAADHFLTLARYNIWANRRLYDAATALSDADYRADRKAFFASLHGTLNHLLVADRIWMRRFTGEGETYDRLDPIPHDDLPALRAAREAEDARILAYVEGLDEAAFTADLVYPNMAGQIFRQPLHLPLTHFFNHQTHHRGQAHALISQAGHEPPSFDLIVFLREM